MPSWLSSSPKYSLRQKLALRNFADTIKSVLLKIAKIHLNTEQLTPVMYPNPNKTLRNENKFCYRRNTNIVENKKHVVSSRNDSNRGIDVRGGYRYTGFGSPTKRLRNDSLLGISLMRDSHRTCKYHARNIGSIRSSDFKCRTKSYCVRNIGYGRSWPFE